MLAAVLAATPAFRLYIVCRFMFHSEVFDIGDVVHEGHGLWDYVKAFVKGKGGDKRR